MINPNEFTFERKSISQLIPICAYPECDNEIVWQLEVIEKTNRFLSLSKSIRPIKTIEVCKNHEEWGWKILKERFIPVKIKKNKTFATAGKLFG